MKEQKVCGESAPSVGLAQKTVRADAVRGNNIQGLKALALCLVVGVVVLLAACAPQANPDPSSEANAEGESSSVASPEDGGASSAWWSTDSDCATCHENSAATLASLTCEAAKADDPSGACLKCHDDTENIASAHADVAMSDTAGDVSYLKVSEIQEDTCLACHNRDDLIAATAGVTDLTDFEGRTINPHEASTVYNVDGAHDGITCGSCHKMHATDNVPTGKTAYDFCAECHHTGVYECNTCH